MMCWVVDCKHYAERETCRFFTFPKDPKKRLRWIKLIRRGDREPTYASRVCSCHFKNGRKENDPTMFERNVALRFEFEDPEPKRRRKCKEDLNSSSILTKDENLYNGANKSNGFTVSDAMKEEDVDIEEINLDHLKIETPLTTTDIDNKLPNTTHSNNQEGQQIQINGSIMNLKNNESNRLTLINHRKYYQEPDFSYFKYWCQICNERFCFPNIFQDHINLHARVKPYKCDLCNKQYATMLHLSQHKEDHSQNKTVEPKLWQCEVCKKYFKAPSILKRHSLQHERNRKKELCTICGIEFFHLQQHVQKCHNKSYSYECDQCGKKFSMHTYLSIHKDKHNDNKRYCCDLCGKTFTFASGLKSHKKAHIYVNCEICKKDFNSKMIYKQHLKINACSSGLTSLD